MQKTAIKIKFQGLANTLDESLVGWDSAYDCSNISLEKGVLQAADGYGIQIAPGSAAAYGFGYGSYLGAEEYIAVLGDKVYTTALSGSTWTQIASGVAQSDWLFQSYAARIYGVNPADGLLYHTIGSTDWSGAGRPPAPPSSGLMYSFERFYNQQLNGENNSLVTYTAVGTNWIVTGFDNSAPYPGASGFGFYYTLFKFNKNTSQSPMTGRCELVVPNVDWSYNDRLRIEVKLNTNSSFRVDNIRCYLVTATTGQLSPIAGTLQTISSKDKIREFYFYGARTDRARVSKLVILFDLSRTGFNQFVTGDSFHIGLWLGDVWQNNTGIALDNGPSLASRKYGYTVYRASTGAESNLSPVYTSLSSPTVNLGSYTRVSLTPVTAAGIQGSDVLRLYRQRVSDGKWVFVGTVPNSGTPWFPPDRNPDQAGTCYVDDHYAEFDLGDLTEFTQPTNLPVSYTPQAIGIFNSSLMLGVGPDLAVSKVDRPLDYELPGDPAPIPDDFSAGRYVFVDPSRSEKVNMILDGEVLYLGTRKRTYFTSGDFPKDLFPPVTVDNNGPIGTRSFAPWGNSGILVLNAEGLWHMEPNRLSASNQAAINSELITVNLANAVSTLAPSASSVVAVHRGNIFVFEGNRYLHRARNTGFWTQGTLPHAIKAAIPDSYNQMRLLTTRGGLLTWGAVNTHAGSAINWYYETGRQQTERLTLAGISYVASGTPSITITSRDGINGETANTYSLSASYKNVQNFEVQTGTEWVLRISGSTTDKLMDLTLHFTGFRGGESL